MASFWLYKNLNLLYDGKLRTLKLQLQHWHSDFVRDHSLE
ncbi:hypothetical protein HSISB1_274 [Streptococcus sp. HSISB1]|nr:hypothetical protein HSISB1_274 [Streptococcus sp. HSISB1]